MRVDLTARDKKLFQTLDEYGMLSTNQLQRLCFTKIAEATALRRIRKLRARKYILSHSGLPKGQLVWTLSLKARQVINSDLEVVVNKNQLEHDILISETKLKLETNKVCHSWVSGFKLKQMISKTNASSTVKTSQQVPDGIFSVQTKSGVKVVALELELVSKTKRRYRDIIENYSNNSKIDWVWYVVSQKSLGEFLCSEANSNKTRNGKKWLFYSQLDEILSPNKTVILKNQDYLVTLIESALPTASQ